MSDEYCKRFWDKKISLKVILFGVLVFAIAYYSINALAMNWYNLGLKQGYTQGLSVGQGVGGTKASFNHYNQLHTMCVQTRAASIPVSCPAVKQNFLKHANQMVKYGLITVRNDTASYENKTEDKPVENPIKVTKGKKKVGK